MSARTSLLLLVFSGVPHAPGAAFPQPAGGGMAPRAQVVAPARAAAPAPTFPSAPSADPGRSLPGSGSVRKRPAGPGFPDREYRVFVASEATDRVSLVVFGPEGGRVEREFEVGMIPTEPDGPHGLAVSPDGTVLYVTTGHGRPWGHLWRFDTRTLREIDRVELGLFPASLDVSPDGRFVHVVNFNLHGDMVPSSVSVVGIGAELGGMAEIARLETCTMPHGSRLAPDGSRQYSTCMMDDLLVEVDAWGLSVRRHFRLSPGREEGIGGAPHAQPHDRTEGDGSPGSAAPAGASTHAGHTDHAGHTGSGDGGHSGEPECSPTWAQPSADGSTVFVACNRTNELVEVDVASWTLRRRIPAGEGVYNVAITRDDALVVATNKRGRSVSLFDRRSGVELARIPTGRPVVHGVVISPDDRYAFISVEGIGSEPGTVEMIDLAARRVVARVDLPQMAAGIAFWR